MKDNRNTSALTEIHIAVLLFGLAGLFGKWVDLPAAIITWGRCAFAFMALFLLILFSKESFSLKRKGHYIVFVCLGVILALHWWSFFHAIQISTVAVGLLTFSTFPVFTVFLEPLFFRERLRLTDIIAALVSFVGIALIVPGFDLGDSTTQGAVFGVLSGLSFAMLQIMNRKYVQHYPGRLISFYQTGIATIVLLPLVLKTQAEFSPKSILLLMVLGVVCTALAHTLFIGGLKSVKVRTASIIAGLEPVYGIIAAILFLHEMPSLREICGGAIILSMAAWVSLKRDR